MQVLFNIYFLSRQLANADAFEQWVAVEGLYYKWLTNGRASNAASPSSMSGVANQERIYARKQERRRTEATLIVESGVSFVPDSIHHMHLRTTIPIHPF